MATRSNEHHWPNYSTKALGKAIQSCTSHASYLALGSTDKDRQQLFHDSFSDYVDKNFIEEIKTATYRVLIASGNKFVNKNENQLNISTRSERSRYLRD